MEGQNTVGRLHWAMALRGLVEMKANQAAVQCQQTQALLCLAACQMDEMTILQGLLQRPPADQKNEESSPLWSPSRGSPQPMLLRPSWISFREQLWCVGDRRLSAWCPSWQAVPECKAQPASYLLSRLWNHPEGVHTRGPPAQVQGAGGHQTPIFIFKITPECTDALTSSRYQLTGGHWRQWIRWSWNSVIGHWRLPPAAADKVQCHCPDSLDETTNLAEDHLSLALWDRGAPAQPPPLQLRSIPVRRGRQFPLLSALILVLTPVFPYFPQGPASVSAPSDPHGFLWGQDRSAGGAGVLAIFRGSALHQRRGR